MCMRKIVMRKMVMFSHFIIWLYYVSRQDEPNSSLLLATERVDGLFCPLVITRFVRQEKIFY